jgi:hypothetical protein
MITDRRKSLFMRLFRRFFPYLFIKKEFNQLDFEGDISQHITALHYTISLTAHHTVMGKKERYLKEHFTLVRKVISHTSVQFTHIKAFDLDHSISPTSWHFTKKRIT